MEPERFQTQPFQGWSVEIHPVRKHRRYYTPELNAGFAFIARTGSKGLSLAPASLQAGRSFQCSEPFGPECGADLLRFGILQKLLKVSVLLEKVAY
jgi:hypothetical protein